jgi:uncharacterized membrane protein
MFDGYVAEWVGLLVRWFHFMMGVAWIGASFYFVWLNNAVRPPREQRPGVAGEVWSVHGGAFYQVQKFGGAPEQLPEHLHWFKWEAYLTWLSGFTLLVLIWWANPSSYMIDPAVRELAPLAAVGIGAATIFGGWLVYDGLCRSPLKDQPVALAAVLYAFVVAVAFGLSELLAPRAAYIHVGAMLGTWMAANVFFVIIPGQRAMVDAMIAKQPPPLERGKAGALRSLHNNYITLPVLFVMISGHFPSTWGHPRGWAILAALGVIGAAYRHWVNLDERGTPKPWLLPAAGLGLLLVAILARPAGPAVASTSEGTSITRVQQIMAARCLRCHATEPLDPAWAAAPKGLVLETPDQIRANAAKIVQRVAVTKDMPLGNLTGMTDEERTEIAAWTAGGGD